MYHKLEENEDPHLVRLNRMDIWLQVYDLPSGLLSDRILQSIGNYVGVFVKTDPTNTNGLWKTYARKRVTMDVEKPIKRRIKVKWEVGSWSWINFKYERFSTLCFVCGLLGHSERDCGIVYDNPEKEIERAYGVWLRAPTINAKNQNIGAKWLRNGPDGGSPWTSNAEVSKGQTTVHGGDRVEAYFMEVDGKLRWSLGDRGVIFFAPRNHGNVVIEKSTTNQGADVAGNKSFETETVVIDMKRSRVDNAKITETDGLENMSVSKISDGPKNLEEAGPVLQARLEK